MPETAYRSISGNARRTFIAGTKQKKNIKITKFSETNIYKELRRSKNSKGRYIVPKTHNTPEKTVETLS